MRSSYDREYISRGVIDRQVMLKERYRMYCNRLNENGDELTAQGAAVARSKCKTDLEILVLIDELLGHIDHDFVLSEDAGKGFEKICMPYERHRVYRGM
jgi:hypothetical protein